MDPFSNTDDFYTLAEEQFDFDVSLSSESSREEGEDEVFVGPVTDEGKVICIGVDHLAMDGVSSGPSVAEEQQTWSPGEDFDRVCSEAQKLSIRLKEDHQPHTEQTDCTVPAEGQGHMEGDFVQDAGAKLDMLSKPFKRVLSPIKRETFCVQDSPVKLLPPAIQKRLLRGGSSNSSNSSVGSGVGVNSTPARLKTSSPASGSKTRTQPKTTLRSKAGLLGTSGILPSKTLLPATSSATSLKHVKTRSVPAENASRLAPSSKVGLRTVPRTRGVVDLRRNVSSSSVSSFNSSMSSISPTGKGKLNGSLNASISGPSSRAPTNMSRLASTASTATAAKTRRCTPVGRAADPPPPPTAAATVRGARRSISVHSRKTSSDATDLSKLAARSTPVKRTVPSTPTQFQQSPAKRATVSSVNSQQQPGPRVKPMAFIAPTPSTRLNGLKRSESVVDSPDLLKSMKPMRLRSAGSLDSLLQEKPFPNTHLFHSTPSVSRIRRPSALPNPVNRSVISGIPAMTPKRLPESGPAEAFFYRKTSNQSSPRVESLASEEELVISPKIQPFSLEDAELAALQTLMPNEALACVKVQSLEVAQEVVNKNPEENMLLPQQDVEIPEENVEPRQKVEENMESQKEVVEHPEENQEPEPSGNLIELYSVEEVISEDHGAKTEEILLLDIPVSLFKPEDKPLIDLCNTPDLIRTVSHKDGEMQLIDLTSPLMKWSPDKKENEAPLINFSF